MELSPQLLEKADDLVRKSKCRSWRYVNTTAKRILLVAIISILLISTAMAIPAVRNAVLGFFVVDKGSAFKFTFDTEMIENAPEQLEAVYFPTYIPDGYHKVEDYWSVKIRKVFLRFSNLNLRQNLSLTALADLFRASLNETDNRGGSS